MYAPNVIDCGRTRKPTVTVREIIRRRLRNHRLVQSPGDDPAAVVAWFGAVQAQDYLGALWAVGQRAPGTVQSDIELALAEGTIVRTWPMRGTLHFVAAEDVRWMLDLLAPRIVRRHAPRLHREFGLDAAALAACRKVLVGALGSGPLPRPQAYQALESKGIPTAGQRGVHILGRLAMEGLICFGPRSEKQQTLVLLDEWVPEGRGLLREEALTELTLRYFTAHGPATARDFAWWSGLTLAEVRAALHLVERRLLHETIEEETYWFSQPDGAALPRHPASAHLLPPFDEYLVGYRDRGAVLDPRHTSRLGALLSPVVEIAGRIAGTWKRELAPGRVTVHLAPFARLPAKEKQQVATAAGRYGKFLGVPATLY